MCYVVFCQTAKGCIVTAPGMKPSGMRSETLVRIPLYHQSVATGRVGRGGSVVRVVLCRRFNTSGEVIPVVLESTTGILLSSSRSSSPEAAAHRQTWRNPLLLTSSNRVARGDDPVVRATYLQLLGLGKHAALELPRACRRVRDLGRATGCRRTLHGRRAARESSC